MKRKPIPPYRVVNWDVNQDKIEFYDIMPYLVNCWDSEKKRKYKTWNISLTPKDDTIDRTKMPETFEEFKKFVDSECHYNFWGRCEYECIVSGWPVEKNKVKIDVYDQIKANLDVVTKHFMDYIKTK